MKLISPKLHGIIDYFLIIFLFLSPVLFGLPGDTGPIVYGLAVLQLVLTVITNYSSGLFRAIPLKLHGVIELLICIGLIAAAYTIFEYDERSQKFCIGLGAFWFIVVIFSDYDINRDGVKAPIL
ncbi:MAG: hypothetical protein JKY70_17690 [Mucilaginibacter sp.]|nr:hypothetical protein [Mucilaginibacter sp.]